MRINIVKVITATCGLLLLTSCGASTGASHQISSAKSLRVVSQEIPRAKRIIALANGSAEIISALGFKKYLVGRDIASTDKDLSQIPILSSGHQVIAEKVIATHPDLVLIDSATGPQNALNSIKSAGIQMRMISDAWQVTDITRKVAEISTAIDSPKAGQLLSKELTAALSRQTSAQVKVKILFLYLRGTSAIYLVGGKGSGADSLISSLGATDIGAVLVDKPFSPLTSEVIAKANPDVILVMSKGLASVGGESGLLELPGVAQTTAGKKRQILAVDDSLLLSFGPRTPDLIAQFRNYLNRVA